LVAYDRALSVGSLGGSPGTTFDAFSQLAAARKHGAKVALYGRTINQSECPQTFLEHLRAVADGHLPAVEAVKSYHDALVKRGVKPRRTLKEDLRATPRDGSYSGTGESAGGQGGGASVPVGV